MNITIGKPCAISEKGSKVNNEDFIFPLPEMVNTNQRLFLVCDGVGGAEKGEIASSLACELFQTYFSTFLEGEPTSDFIAKALRYTEAHFESYVAEHPEAAGMATTLTMLYIGYSGITLAHIGDSRIYQFRNGEIIYQTEDHSLVNSLYKSGKINSEEMLHHPQRNIILRAIQGSSQPVTADVALIQDIQPGDYFFMCTDGMMENLTNETLSLVFKRQLSPDAMKDLMMESCDGKTRDNFSFYIIPIQNVQESAGIKQNILSFFYSFI
ncbi:MAG: protein phosphatase 2C domain-containing protein [Tannerellaceae bacterium]|jgi:protein phosphatase|nr:protein phosphatase 2C domain-containing protein [Tannerellaceae bacterium]